MSQNFQNGLIIRSPMLIALAWFLLDTSAALNFVLCAVSLIVIFIGVNLYSSIKFYKEKFLGKLSILYLACFLPLSFTSIWGKHYASVSEQNQDNYRRIHKHSLWQIGHKHQ